MTGSAPISLAPMLAEIQSDLAAGRRPQAYQLSRQATSLAPANTDAWLWRALTTESLEESLFCLSQILSLDPQHAIARHRMHVLFAPLLQRDSFLAYEAEADGLYHVRTGSGQPVVVPKERVAVEPYPPRSEPPLAAAYRWLGFAVLGLALAGLGAMICAPVAAWRASRWLQQPLRAADRARVMILLGVAALIWSCGLVLFGLLLVHL